ncbi:hypothetical protein LTR17_023217 [Elasticomyces elasticus]|nr:hypothetical protein LTR17_023217 [Elasticomyces elasticus]
MAATYVDPPAISRPKIAFARLYSLDLTATFTIHSLEATSVQSDVLSNGAPAKSTVEFHCSYALMDIDLTNASMLPAVKATSVAGGFLANDGPAKISVTYNLTMNSFRAHIFVESGVKEGFIIQFSVPNTHLPDNYCGNLHQPTTDSHANCYLGNGAVL